MAPSTEVTIFDANDAYRDNPRSVNLAFDVLVKADGVHTPFFYGNQIENQNTAYIFVDWDDTPAHKAFVAGPLYPDLFGAFKSYTPSNVQMYHVHFSAPMSVLVEPVTQVLVLTLKAPENRATVVDLFSQVAQASGKTLVYGNTEEDENKYVVLVGWPSVEAHHESATRPEVAEKLEKLQSLTNKEHLFHTKLSQYTGL